MKTSRLIFIFFILISCKQEYDIKGIVVSESLAANTWNKEYDYRELLEKSVDKNLNAIKEFSLLPIGDGTGYEHGAVLVDLINLIGEEDYIRAIRNIRQDDKEIIRSFLEVGLEYGGNPKYSNKKLENAFPKIYEFLNK